jgi:hypothetical protein
MALPGFSAEYSLYKAVDGVLKFLIFDHDAKHGKQELWRIRRIRTGEGEC